MGSVVQVCGEIKRKRKTAGFYCCFCLSQMAKFYGEEKKKKKNRRRFVELSGFYPGKTSVLFKKIYDLTY